MEDVQAGAEFFVDDIVEVRSRFWPGINKPGGVAKIIKVTYNGG